MTQVFYGERISKTGKLAVGCNSIVFDPTRTKVLLIRRADNGQWSLPGGFMESGESVTEACEREVREETGTHIRVIRLIGVYSDPHRVTEYSDGNRYHFVTLCFEGEAIKQESSTSLEATETGYFSRDELEQMDVIEAQLSQINDAFENRADTVVC